MNSEKAYNKRILLIVFVGLALSIIPFISNWLMLIHVGENPTYNELIDISFYYFTPFVTWLVLTGLIIRFIRKWKQRSGLWNSREFLLVIFIGLLISPIIRTIDILLDFSIKYLVGMIETNPLEVLNDVWLVVVSSSPAAFLRLLIIILLAYYLFAKKSDIAILTIKASDGVFHVLEKGKIIYIQSSGNYLDIQTSDNCYRARMTLKSLELNLDDSFQRIHKSTIINRSHIRQMSHWRNGEYLVVMSDGKPLTSSKTYKSSIDQIKTYLSANERVKNDPFSAIVRPTLG